MNAQDQSNEHAGSRHASLLRKAQFYSERGDVANFNEYHGQFCEVVRGAVSGDMAADSELAPFLYIAGEHDVILQLYEQHKERTANDLLPMLAASVFFVRKEPHQALKAAKHIRNPEQRRLRQKTAELWERLHAPLAAEPRVHLLLLTCDREQYVTEALRQLARTDYANYAVYIADNGSSDKTLALAREAADFFPARVPVHIQSFPTNIGRPAGHNWLLTGHDHRAAEFIAIGDDDLVHVPPDWLTRMVQTARAFPDCGCVGGKALTPGWPPVIHCGIRNFTAFGPTTIKLNNACDENDLGQFDYVDAVDHVIGCLHIFDRAVLEKVGLFDISLSPCQCVDIEHHLRMRLAGYDIIFNGLIAFEHYRAMGNKLKQDEALRGNSLGNVVKILSKYDHKTVNEGIRRWRAARNQWLELEDTADS